VQGFWSTIVFKNVTAAWWVAMLASRIMDHLVLD
jgi:hypothetical protein